MPPALDDPAVREERDDRLRATVFHAGRPVRNRSASPLRAPHLSAATHTREPSVDLSTAPDTRPSRLPLDNIPELDCAPTEVKSSAGAATPHESEVELPSNNNTAPKTPCPAEKKNSSAAVTPVKTPKTSRASKRKLEFPEGEEYAFPCMQCFKGALSGKGPLSCCAVKDKPNLKRCYYCSRGSRKGCAGLTCTSVIFELFEAYPTLFTISDRHILPSRVFEIPHLGLGALASNEGSFPGVIDPEALDMIYNSLARLGGIIPVDDDDEVEDEDEDIGDDTD
ncbi:hypothetical protein H9Q72_014490, partial [Fusarium xylarioides]